MAKENTVGALAILADRQDVPEDARNMIREVVEKARSTPLDTDLWIYRAVVIVLGSCVLLTVVGGIGLTFYGKGAPTFALPDAIVAIGSAAVGALAGLLAPSPAKAG